jgi:hypothetical protein
VPGKTLIEIPKELQEEMLKEIRAVRYGHLLWIHILLLCDAGLSATEISRVLYCSRSSVYRAVEKYRRGEIEVGIGWRDLCAEGPVHECTFHR